MLVAPVIPGMVRGMRRLTVQLEASDPWTETHPGGFATFYTETYPSILRFFARQTRDGQVALDLTAETFAKAFENRSRFRGSTQEEATGWLWSIARNELKMFWRSLSVELEAIKRLGLNRPEASEDELRRIEDLAAVEAASGEIGEALATLSPDQQEAVRLHVIDEMGYEEIAERLQLTNAVVRSRVSRGLRRLAGSSKLRNFQASDTDSKIER